MVSTTQHKVFIEDRLAGEWREIEQRREELSKEITKYVKENGVRSRKKPGMRIVQGAEFEIALIEITLRQIRDKKAFARFLGVCPLRLANRIMRRSLRYTFNSDAEKILVRRASAKALTLFRRAVKTKKSKPRLTVRELKSAKQRKAAA